MRVRHDPGVRGREDHEQSERRDHDRREGVGRAEAERLEDRDRAEDARRAMRRRSSWREPKQVLGMNWICPADKPRENG